MATINDLIKQAFHKLNVVGENQAPQAQQQQRALTAVNHLIESWNIDRTVIFALQEEGITLVSSQRVYPVGTISITSLTSASTTATATTASEHGYTVGMNVTVSGATQTEYNGAYAIVSVPSTTTFTYTFAGSATTPATGTITCGITGITNRPTRILHATITKDSNDYPVEIITYDQYMDIFTKSNESQVPRWLYYEPTFPLGKIYLYYTPSEANSLNIATEVVQGAFSLNDSVSLPPGYERALVYNLAHELLLEYPSEAMGPMIRDRARDSLKDIRRVNSQSVMKEAKISVPGRYRDRSYFNHAY